MRRGCYPGADPEPREKFRRYFTAIAASHVCDRAETDEMNRHLADIAAAMPQDPRATAVLDCADRHRSKSLATLDKVTMLHLPPYSLEPDPVETVFRFLEQGSFAKQAFATADEVKDRVEKDWNDFARTRGRIVHWASEAGQD